MNRGKIIVIEGLPGAGKSSLLKCLSEQNGVKVLGQNLQSNRDKLVLLMFNASEIIARMMGGNRKIKLTKDQLFPNLDISKIRIARKYTQKGMNVAIESSIPFTVFYFKFLEQSLTRDLSIEKQLKYEKALQPDICIWVEATPKVALERQLKRGLTYYSFNDPQYLSQLKEFTFAFWRKHYSSAKVITIDNTGKTFNTSKGFR